MPPALVEGASSLDLAHNSLRPVLLVFRIPGPLTFPVLAVYHGSILLLSRCDARPGPPPDLHNIPIAAIDPPVVLYMGKDKVESTCTSGDS